MLARSPDLSVVARNSSFTYKDKATDVRQIGKDLGVDYVVEGFVRKEADEVGISARLIDANTGEFVWPNRFEKAGTDPLALTDQLTSKIMGIADWRQRQTPTGNVSNCLGEGHSRSRRVRLLSSWPRSLREI